MAEKKPDETNKKKPAKKQPDELTDEDLAVVAGAGVGSGFFDDMPPPFIGRWDENGNLDTDFSS